MKTFLKIVALMLLALNGAGAFYGGWHLITHPDGSSLQMPLSYLEHSPFEDFFYPGFILFIANGLFSWFVFAAYLFRLKDYKLLVIAQGIVLTVWIATEMLMLQSIHWLHLVYGPVGLLLIMIGWMTDESEDGQKSDAAVG